MEHWIAQLREQTRQIAQGPYQRDNTRFADAPAEIRRLSEDIDGLAQVLAERETARIALVKEVHHRVKGNLQTVTSLVEMQANSASNLAEREGFGRALARLGALALIYRIFYEQDDEIGQSSIDIARLFAELCAQFRVWNRYRANIGLSCQACSYPVRLDRALPLALFAVEALINAYGHASPHARSGYVTLDFRQARNGAHILSIRDNGIGFAGSGLPDSMGHQLMQGFAAQLGGTYQITGKPGKGTVVRLEFNATRMK